MQHFKCLELLYQLTFSSSPNLLCLSVLKTCCFQEEIQSSGCHLQRLSFFRLMDLLVVWDFLRQMLLVPRITFLNFEIKYSSPWSTTVCGQLCTFISLTSVSEIVTVSIVSFYRHTPWVSRSSRNSQVLIAVDQLMREMITCLSNLHSSCEIRQM